MTASITKRSDTERAFPWVPILAFGFAWFLAVAIELSPAGLLSDIARDLRISDAAVGTMTTFYALGNAVLVIPLTALATRVGYRSALGVVMAVFVASNVAVALSPSIVIADASRFVGGASYALICTLFPAVLVRLAGPRNAGRALTVVFTCTGLGAALGAPFASLVGDAFGWRVVFLGAAALSLGAGVLIWFTAPRIREVVEHPISIWQTIRIPGVLRTAVGWALVMLAHFIVLTYIEAYLQHIGMPSIITSAALLVIGGAGIAGTILISRVATRSVFIALVISPVTVGVGLALLYLAGSTLAAVLVGIAIWGIGISAAVVINQRTLLITGHRAPEAATSIGVLLAQAGFAAGASIGGFTLTTVGVGAIPLVALAFVAASVAIAITLRTVVRHGPEQA